MVFRQIRSNVKFSTFVLYFASFIFLTGCGSAWKGRVVWLDDGRLVIRPEGDAPIESGQKVLIYREKTIVHPATGEVLGTIRDNIAEVLVLWVRDRTITAGANEPEFPNVMIEDQAIALRGRGKPKSGSVSKVGEVEEVDADAGRVRVRIISRESALPNEVLTVIRYAGTIIDPDTGDLLAVSVEPVANLRVENFSIDSGSEPYVQADYELMDKKLGWIEVGDVVVRRTGDMLTESLWFQDPPDGFSPTWLLSRNYLHAVRLFNLGQYREAILELTGIIQADSQYGDAMFILGLCFLNLKRYEEAEKQFKDLLNVRGDDAKVWTALLYTYLQQEKLQESARSLEKLSHLLPDEPKVWIDLGDIFQKLGDDQKAEQAYRKALEIAPDSAPAIYEREKS